MRKIVNQEITRTDLRAYYRHNWRSTRDLARQQQHLDTSWWMTFGSFNGNDFTMRLKWMLDTNWPMLHRSNGFYTNQRERTQEYFSFCALRMFSTNVEDLAVPLNRSIVCLSLFLLIISFTRSLDNPRVTVSRQKHLWPSLAASA